MVRVELISLCATVRISRSHSCAFAMCCGVSGLLRLRVVRLGCCGLCCDAIAALSDPFAVSPQRGGTRGSAVIQLAHSGTQRGVHCATARAPLCSAAPSS